MIGTHLCVKFSVLLSEIGISYGNLSYLGIPQLWHLYWQISLVTFVFLFQYLVCYFRYILHSTILLILHFSLMKTCFVLKLHIRYTVDTLWFSVRLSILICKLGISVVIQMKLVNICKYLQYRKTSCGSGEHTSIRWY